jgi:GntR family transcriptional regulator
MINLNYQSRISIYEQIISEIEKYVALGIYKPNEQLPSVRELAGNLGINPNTVKKAYTELEKRGVITTISTKGSFVSDNINKVIDSKVNEALAEIKDIISSLEKLGLKKKEIFDKLKD